MIDQALCTNMLSCTKHAMFERGRLFSSGCQSEQRFIRPLAGQIIPAYRACWTTSSEHAQASSASG